VPAGAAGTALVATQVPDRLGRALLGTVLCTAAFARAGALLAFPAAREAARLVIAEGGVLVGR
jgi:uncharacterized metal-binding protein